MNYTLREIASIVGGRVIGNENIVVNGINYDSRVIQKKQMFAPFVGEKVDGHKFVADLFRKDIDASFWQEDCLLDLPSGNLVIVKDVLEAIQTLAAYYRSQCSIPFIGVTGSSGKTSTKDIIAAVLSAKYRVYKTDGNHNNKLGVPMTVLNMSADAEVAVIEMGIDDIGIMDQLAEIVKPDYTVITSIAPAHIQQFKTIDKIIQQKCLINKYLPQNGYCFYNSDYPAVKEQLLKMNLQKQIKSFGFDDASDLQVVNYRLENSNSYFQIKQYPDFTFHIPILGKHQVCNALAAISIGEKLQMTAWQMQQGLEKVRLTARRMQTKFINNCLVIDDSYNSNPSSLVASLDTFIEYDNRYHKIVVLGDMLELGNDSAEMHGDIADKVDFNEFEKIYLIGEEMKNLSEKLKQKQIKSSCFDDWKQAVPVLKGEIKKENIIFFKASNGMNFSGLISALED
ncbi:MAG: UDP-N-acetylmuramoyl-tripeptide--D-alanyl-D-alanine ligase [Erysipelotrichia bacterium]|nr:UDP-N-acetylmuramoyl-tripeptide--D-alanyl-D-alanine ligase [Erysipelotrichia bacterium]